MSLLLSRVGEGMARGVYEVVINFKYFLRWGQFAQVTYASGMGRKCTLVNKESRT